MGKSELNSSARQYGEQNGLKALKLFISSIALLAAAACSQNPGVSPDASISTSDLGTGIIGGQDANGNEDFSKSIVALYNREQGSLCTATILSDSILVSAAHCVDGPASSLVVVFGNSLEGGNLVVRQVDAYQTSPLWAVRQNEDFNTGDISIVKFSGGLAPGYRAAQVLRDETALQNGGSVLLSGYGLSNGSAKTGSGVLRYVEVTIGNNAFSESEVLMDQRQGKGACHGDSGGPAFVKVNGRWMLFGVTSRGVNDPGDTCGVSAAYTKVPYYASWIQKTAKKLMSGSAFSLTQELAVR